MTGGSRRDDKHQPGDALDRAIDETLGAAMHTHVVDLRERVLARLDEPAETPAAWWRFVLRPALLPAAGAALVVVAVAFTWQHVDDTLARIGSRQPTASVARAGSGTAPRPSSLVPRPSSPAPSASALQASADSRPSSLPPSPPGIRRTGVPAAVSDRVILAESLLDMDAMSKPAGVAADTVLMGDDASPAPSFPGAPAGDLGDPIKPMPPLRPIEIHPIVPAPIVTPPIVDAPPVSTLAPPVSTFPTVGEISRDPIDPGKPGGVRQ
jgi:hypothetical protein